MKRMLELQTLVLLSSFSLLSSFVYKPAKKKKTTRIKVRNIGDETCIENDNKILKDSIVIFEL